MKKTALTMTDSDKLATEKDPELTDFHPKTYKEENHALRIIVEQQEVAMDMIMRKYREQIDNLTKVSHLDVRKLHYKRFLDTIVNQANKMDEMTTMMRKNLLIIFKYEEVMRQIESENESLRALVKQLTLTTKEAERKADIGRVTKNNAENQTHILEYLVCTVDKSVGTSGPEYDNTESGILTPEKRDGCTDMILYTPFSSFANLSINETRSPAEPLDVDAVCDFYETRFSDETEKPICGSTNLHDIGYFEFDEKSPSEVRITEDFGDSSEELTSSTRASTDISLTEVDELSSENSIVSLTEGSSKVDSTEPVNESLS